MTAVRLRLRRADFDEYGFLHDQAVRRLHGSLWDAPNVCVPVVIDLGPCRHRQDQLIYLLAGLPCAPDIRFEARDWRTVREHRNALARELDEAA